MNLQGNKKPITTCRGDGLDIREFKTLNGQPTPQRKRHHQVLRRLSEVGMGAVSPSWAGSVNCRTAAGIYFFPVFSRFFLYLRVNSTNRGVRPMSS